MFIEEESNSIHYKMDKLFETGKAYDMLDSLPVKIRHVYYKELPVIFFLTRSETRSKCRQFSKAILLVLDNAKYVEGKVGGIFNSFVHAWIETEEKGKEYVYDTTWLVKIEKKAYYKLRKVSKVLITKSKQDLERWYKEIDVKLLDEHMEYSAYDSLTIPQFNSETYPQAVAHCLVCEDLLDILKDGSIDNIKNSISRMKNINIYKKSLISDIENDLITEF